MGVISRHPRQQTSAASSIQCVSVWREGSSWCFLIGLLGHFCKKFVGFSKLPLELVVHRSWIRHVLPEVFSPSFCCNVLNDAFWLFHSVFYTFVTTSAFGFSCWKIWSLHGRLIFNAPLALFFCYNICMQLWVFKNRRPRSLKKRNFWADEQMERPAFNFVNIPITSW